MAAIIQEYSYDDDTRHLEDSEALEKYKSVKALHPDALVVLDDLKCGHWDVEVYKTEEEKQEYLQEAARSFLDRFIEMFRKL